MSNSQTSRLFRPFKSDLNTRVVGVYLEDRRKKREVLVIVVNHQAGVNNPVDSRLEASVVVGTVTPPLLRMEERGASERY